MLALRFVPIRQIFYNKDNNYRVLACVPINPVPDQLELNNYKNFILCGSNLSNYQLQEEYEAIIDKTNNTKYTCSYIITGVPGLNVENNEIIVQPDCELSILSHLMTKKQAQNILQIYPNFVQQVLRDEIDQIDFKKIYNVGKNRLNLYITKIKQDCKNILFYPTCLEYGITNDADICKLTNYYLTPNDLKKDLYGDNPYTVLIDKLKWGFYKSDQLILSNTPAFINTSIRCKYACLFILEEWEINYQHTRMPTKLVREILKDIAPETMEHIVSILSQCSDIYYDPDTKNCSRQSTYLAELNITNNIKYRLASPVKMEMNWKNYDTIDNFKCTDEQIKILQLACTESVMMLNGPAGTGKSSSEKALIRMLDDHHKSYLLLAPTGIAAKKITEYTGRQAFTIHRFLTSLYDSQDPPIFDFVIIDEFSMCGVKLISTLLDTLPSDCKLIFICDESQLSSISCGNLVQDIIDSNRVPTVNLTKVFRYGTGGISTVATDIRLGKISDMTIQYPDFHYIPINDNCTQQVIDTYLQCLKNYKRNDIMVLAPYNIGPKGTYIINNMLQEIVNNGKLTDFKYNINKIHVNFKIGDKVLNNKNTYDQEDADWDDNGKLVPINTSISIANGDIGYIIDEYSNEYTNEYYLYVQFNNGIAVYTPKDITRLNLAYAMSIHKSQGSQAKVVILLVDKSHQKNLSRNLLYVGASRAEEQLYLISDINTIQSALPIQENKTRYTWLKNLLITNNI